MPFDAPLITRTVAQLHAVWVHDRRALGTGEPLAQVLDPSHGAETQAALQAACQLARSSGLPVSLPALGDLTDLPGSTQQALTRSGLAPDRLELSIEAAHLRNPGFAAILALSELRDRGVHVALSGFGHGSLGGGVAHGMWLIPRLPLSRIILAPSAIRTLPDGLVAAAALRALVDVARSHGFGVVATGIDTEAQRAILSGLGCEAGEGSLFGQPMLHRSVV